MFLTGMKEAKYTVYTHPHFLYGESCRLLASCIEITRIRVQTHSSEMPGVKINKNHVKTKFYAVIINVVISFALQ